MRGEDIKQEATKPLVALTELSASTAIKLIAVLGTIILAGSSKLAEGVSYLGFDDEEYGEDSLVKSDE